MKLKPFTKFLLVMGVPAMLACLIMYLGATDALPSGKQPWSILKVHTQANQTLVEVGSWCSGTIIDAEKGLVVTAAHCTEKVHIKKYIKVQKPSGEEVRYLIDRFDPITVTLHKFSDTGDDIGFIKYRMLVRGAVYPQDIAILQNVSDEKFTGEVTMSLAPLKYGDRIMTVGNPMMFYQTIAEGRVTKPKYKIDVGSGEVEVLCFDSFMAPGSSGGGLFNEYGELVGITNWGIAGGPYLASPAQNVINLLNELGFGKTDRLASAQ
jgi:S1-C subfamily serine protease